MSSTVSSAAAAVTSNCANLYDTPTHDANCAIPYGGNHTSIMTTCCNGANVVSYYNNCGLYCLAVDQTVQDLIDCLYKNGAVWQDVFCSGNTTATATETGAALPTSANASVVVGTSTGTTRSSSTASASSSSSSSSASDTRPQAILSTLGLAIGALLFSAAAFGAQQI